MCEFFDKLENIGFEKGIEKGFEKGIEKGFAKGIEKGFAKGKISALTELVKKKILSLKQAAEEMGMTVANFEIAMKELATN